MALNVNTNSPVTTAQAAITANSPSTSKVSTGTSSATAGATSGDQISLSAQAQQLLASKNRGALVFDAIGATVGGKRVALTDIINSTDGTYSDTERKAAVRQINQRETAGFRWAKPTTQDPVALKQYYATYLNYITKLPPEEQNSDRYKGQIDVARKLIKEADRQIAIANVSKTNLSSYSNDGNGLFGPLMSRISNRITQQMAGLPATNYTTTARYYQQVISHARTADQVLASPEPKTTSSGSSGTKSTQA
jgi:hypothetical protein